jgi:hypothetical protein
LDIALTNASLVCYLTLVFSITIVKFNHYSQLLLAESQNGVLFYFTSVNRCPYTSDHLPHNPDRKMYMSCNNMGSRGTSKKMGIAMISGAGAGAAGIAYVSLAANPAASAALPAVLAFAACPAMCAAMGGAMWLSRRFSKRKNQTQVQEPVANPKQETAAATITESIENK